SRIADPAGEGMVAFTVVYEDSAMQAATLSDERRGKGNSLSLLDGIPVSIKDLFDVAGDVTRAGSVALRGSEPAKADAAIVARLRAAGAIIVGRTNMTEFAFSGVGLNPHFGTPRNAFDRETGRIPGGSSSGAAVSVADGMAAAAIGTDTGGSVRIPSALNGLSGFKPTQKRIPLDGVFPLSASLDTVGPLAPTVHCCALLDAAMAGKPISPPRPRPVAGLRFAVPETILLDDLEDAVAIAFMRALDTLSDAGAVIDRIPLSELAEIPALNAKGGIICYEAYRLHERLIAERGALYDPRVRTRMEIGRAISSDEYETYKQRRAEIRQRVAKTTVSYDALLAPTTPSIAPPIADLASDEGYWRFNGRMLRNTSLFNFLDRPALSIPCHGRNTPPVGLMVVGESDDDESLISVGLGIEAALENVWR
ncbi:MAG: amidase, partial [Rhodospirillales bacterium]|nr:amidase [Rhodospirillales bacterium]